MKMANFGVVLFITLVLCQLHCSFGLIEQGIFNFEYKESGPTSQFSPKVLYKNTNISVVVNCSSAGSTNQVTIEWLLWWSPCANMFATEFGIDNVALFETVPDNKTISIYPKDLYFQMSAKQELDCNGIIHLKYLKPEVKTTVAPTEKTTVASVEKDKEGKTRKKREEKATVAPKNEQQVLKSDKNEIDKMPVTTTTEDGAHLFVLRVILEEDDSATATVYMEGPRGYLSAHEWPLLPFYGTMSLIYLFYGILWLIMMACNWKDLLRVQFWIGIVILMGMLEKAVFFAEFESVNINGKSVTGALVIAEVISALKRTFARVLVIIVSLGFGIVKPRLGPLLHKVLGVGLLYFIVAVTESCVRALNTLSQNKAELIIGIILSLLEAGMCWWIFVNLVNTTRTLRLRRNVVKLTLYRHFTNTLIFAVIASVACMIWSIKQHRLADCLSDWRELWVDTAFWHILFGIMLFIIMVLWRPSMNNQRYAFTPLLDAAEEEEEDEEAPANDAFDAKMRSSKTKAVVPKDKAKSVDEDLKWIEDNIPASVADTALPSLLDSDEEVMTTKYEMSKME